MSIIAINAEYRNEVNRILKDEWNCPPSVSKGVAIDTTALAGFISLSNNILDGVITYNIENNQCEIVTLNCFNENRGIGTALINSVVAVAKKHNCQRIWLITTNDNVEAIRFYQLKGFDLVAVYINSMEKAREIKPSIPLIGFNNIPIKHEFEFEIRL